MYINIILEGLKQHFTLLKAFAKMSTHSKSSSSSYEYAYIRMPNKACTCGKKFAIRSCDSAKYP